jgi:hypothetical protein
MDPISTSQVRLLQVITNKTSEDPINQQDLKYLIDNGLVTEAPARQNYVKQQMQPWKKLDPIKTYRLTHMGQQVLKNAWR